MTKNRKSAEQMYIGIHDKEHISEDFLYNSICFFGISPEKVVDALNDMPWEVCIDLSNYFHIMREATKKIMDHALKTDESLAEMYTPEIEDVLYHELFRFPYMGYEEKNADCYSDPDK